MISFGSFFIPYSTVEGIHVFTGVQLHLWPEGPALAQMDSLQELCRSFLHTDKWAAVLLALWVLAELSPGGWLWFSVLMVTCAVVPDLVSKAVPVLGTSGWVWGLPGRGCSQDISEHRSNIWLKYWEVNRQEQSQTPVFVVWSLPEEAPFQLLTIALLCNYSFGWKIPTF